ncbi:MAG: VCBS repeat-containing protein [Planctomycetes bacterium]|nr:VCBS repeat-containing protein [Planctomycetota bacterium]
MRLSINAPLAALLLPGFAAAQVDLLPGASLLTGQRPSATAFGDFDLDGDQDLAVTTDNLDKVEIWSNDGLGGFTQTAVIFTGAGTGADALVAGDFNADGQVDLAVCLKNVNQVRVLANAGGAFTAAQTMTVGASPEGIAAGDLDGDGDLDLVTANRDGNSVSVLLNGGGTFGAAATTAVGADLRGITAADFGGDGQADVAVSSHDSREVFVMTSAAGTLGAPSAIFVGGNVRPDGLTAADLNGDGLLDLAVSTSGTGFNQVQVYLGTGAGFGAALIAPVAGVNPDAIVAADFDLDGDMDLVTSDQDSNSISLLTGNGDGTFGAATAQPTGARPGGLSTADVDGDGDVDLACANRDGNSVSLFVNQAPNGGVATNYCTGAPNSVGAGASIGFAGSLSIADGSFTLTASGAVPGQNGLFYYGGGQTAAPFGDGIRCVAAPFFRLNPPVACDVAGNASAFVDFTSGPAGSGASAIIAGSTWNFQFWYRDPAGPSAFNLSNGLRATFVP